MGGEWGGEREGGVRGGGSVSEGECGALAAAPAPAPVTWDDVMHGRHGMG
jgi:hypothetical protein